MTMKLPFDPPYHGAAPFEPHVVRETYLDESEYYVSRGSCRSEVTDHEFVNCGNALCPLGALRTFPGSKELMFPSCPSSPRWTEYTVTIPQRPAPSISPVAAVVTRTPPCSTAPRAEDIHSATCAASAATYTCAAPTVPCPCYQYLHWSPQDLCCGAGRSADRPLKVSTLSCLSRTPRKCPPSTARLLMVDWTPPASFSTRADNKDPVFPSASGKKRRKKKERMPRSPVPVLAAPASDHQTSASPGASSPPVSSPSASLPQRVRSLQRPNQDSAVCQNNGQRSLIDTESQTVGIPTEELQKPHNEISRLTKVVFNHFSSACEVYLSQGPPIAKCNKSNVPGVFSRNNHPLQGHIGFPFSQNAALAGQNNPAVHPLHTVNRIPNFPVGLSSAAFSVRFPVAPLARSEEATGNQLLLRDTPGVKKPSPKEAPPAGVASGIHASTSNPSSVPEPLKPLFFREMQKSDSDETTVPATSMLEEISPDNEDTTVPPTPMSQDIVKLQLESLPRGGWPSAIEEICMNGALGVGAPIMSDYVANTEMPPTAEEAKALLPLLLWPRNMGAFQLCPAVLKAICAEWVRLQRSKKLQRQRQ